MNDPMSFLNTLFHFSFHDFITTRIIPLLYGLWLAVSGIIALAIIVSAFGQGPVAGLNALLVIAPLYFLISVVYGRVLLEFVIVVFRIAEDVRQIARDASEGTRGS